MAGELSRYVQNDIKSQTEINRKNVNSEKGMSIKELNDAINDEFKTVAKEAEREDFGDDKHLDEEQTVKLDGETLDSDDKDVSKETGCNGDVRSKKEMPVDEMNDAIDNEFRRVAKEAEPQEECDKEGLSDKERMQIREETGWSDKVIDNIDNMEQYKIYKEAGLKEVEINGRTCLIKKNIDLDYVDPKTGMTNRELMANGRAPIDSNTGEKIELHHMGQKHDAPLVELCEQSEHGDGNSPILHPKTENSWRSDQKLCNRYNNIEKPNHWKDRAKEA